MDIYRHRNEKLLSANDLRLQGLHEEAIAAYTRAIETLGSLHDAEYAVENYLSRGLAYRAKGLFREALADYDEAVHLVSHNPMSRYAYDMEAYFYRANARAVTGDMKRAVEDHMQAIQIDPKYDYFGIQLFHIHPNDLSLAISDCNQALASDASAYTFYYFRGVARQAMGDLSSALEDYDVAVYSDNDRLDELCSKHRRSILERMSTVNPSDSSLMRPNTDYCRVSWDPVSGLLSADYYDVEKHEQKTVGQVKLEDFCDGLEADGWEMTGSRTHRDGIDYYYQRHRS